MPQNATGGGSPWSAGGVGRVSLASRRHRLCDILAPNYCSERLHLSLRSLCVVCYDGQRPGRESLVEPTCLTHKEDKAQSVS